MLSYLEISGFLRKKISCFALKDVTAFTVEIHPWHVKMGHTQVHMEIPKATLMQIHLREFINDE